MENKYLKYFFVLFLIFALIFALDYSQNFSENEPLGDNLDKNSKLSGKAIDNTTLNYNTILSSGTLNSFNCQATINGGIDKLKLHVWDESTGNTIETYTAGDSVPEECPYEELDEGPQMLSIVNYNNGLLAVHENSDGCNGGVSWGGTFARLNEDYPGDSTDRCKWNNGYSIDNPGCLGGKKLIHASVGKTGGTNGEWYLSLSSVNTSGEYNDYLKVWYGKKATGGSPLGTYTLDTDYNVPFGAPTELTIEAANWPGDTISDTHIELNHDFTLPNCGNFSWGCIAYDNNGNKKYLDEHKIEIGCNPGSNNVISAPAIYDCYKIDGYQNGMIQLQSAVNYEGYDKWDGKFNLWNDRYSDGEYEGDCSWLIDGYYGMGNPVGTYDRVPGVGDSYLEWDSSTISYNFQEKQWEIDLRIISTHSSGLQWKAIKSGGMDPEGTYTRVYKGGPDPNDPYWNGEGTDVSEVNIVPCDNAEIVDTFDDDKDGHFYCGDCSDYPLQTTPNNNLNDPGVCWVNASGDIVPENKRTLEVYWDQVEENIDCSKRKYSVCSKCIQPGAKEVCDGVDNNCDGRIDDRFYDADKDGWKESGNFYPDAKCGDCNKKMDNNCSKVTCCLNSNVYSWTMNETICTSNGGTIKDEWACENNLGTYSKENFMCNEHLGRYAKCGICINPQAEELCDDIDNNCGVGLCSDGDEKLGSFCKKGSQTLSDFGYICNQNSCCNKSSPCTTCDNIDEGFEWDKDTFTTCEGDCIDNPMETYEECNLTETLEDIYEHYSLSESFSGFSDFVNTAKFAYVAGYPKNYNGEWVPDLKKNISDKLEEVDCLKDSFKGCAKCIGPPECDVEYVFVSKDYQNLGSLQKNTFIKLKNLALDENLSVLLRQGASDNLDCPVSDVSDAEDNLIQVVKDRVFTNDEEENMIEIKAVVKNMYSSSKSFEVKLSSGGLIDSRTWTFDPCEENEFTFSLDLSKIMDGKYMVKVSEMGTLREIDVEPEFVESIEFPATEEYKREPGILFLNDTDIGKIHTLKDDLVEYNDKTVKEWLEIEFDRRNWDIDIFEVEMDVLINLGLLPQPNSYDCENYGTVNCDAKFGKGIIH